MDRPTFIKNINLENLEFYIKIHFDKLMALYDIIGIYDNYKVNVINNDVENITFNIIFRTSDEAAIIKNNIESWQPMITKYNITYNIITNCNDNVLYIDLQRASL